jgi:hypothetical protein
MRCEWEQNEEFVHGIGEQGVQLQWEAWVSLVRKEHEQNDPPVFPWRQQDWQACVVGRPAHFAQQN